MKHVILLVAHVLKTAFPEMLPSVLTARPITILDFRRPKLALRIVLSGCTNRPTLRAVCVVNLAGDVMGQNLPVPSVRRQVI